MTKKFLLLALFLVFSLLHGGCEKSDSRLVIVDQANVETGTEKEWLVFKNDEFGFEFEYPETLNEGFISVRQDNNVFYLEGLNPIGHPFSLPITIGNEIRNSDELGGFIRKKYGELCDSFEIDYKSPENGLYPVTISMSGGIDEGCWINWITVLRYSPEQGKVVAFDLGQEIQMVEISESKSIEEIDYTSKLVSSFRFLNGLSGSK